MLKLINFRDPARAIGILFIIGTVSGILSAIITKPILDAPDYLSKISANESQLIFGSIFVLIMAFALAMIPVIAYPVLKKHNVALALGYIVFRGALETTVSIALAGSLKFISFSIN